MKKKSAKQMFEDLGYSVLIDDEYQICYDNKKEKKGVIFYYEDVKFILRNSKRDIDMPLLKAINQQCKELEWI